MKKKNINYTLNLKPNNIFVYFEALASKFTNSIFHLKNILVFQEIPVERNMIKGLI